MPRQVLVLNTTYEPVNVCSTRRAVVLLLKDKADIVEFTPASIRSESLSLPEPQIIRLRHFVRVPRGERRRISRRTVLARDGFRCQYCGSTHHLTIDHVIPRSRGGETSWDNVVASCAACNVRKGASLPGEVGMAPSRKPRPPSMAEFLLSTARSVPDSWEPYLQEAIA